MEASTEVNVENATNETRDDGKIKVWKFDCSLAFIKSIFGIFNIALMVLSLLCLIILSAAKNVACYATYTSAYDFFNFSFGSCLLTYAIRFVVYVLSFETRFLWIFPWLIWNCCVSLFFAFCFFFSSVAVLAVSCGKQSGYSAAGAFGLISWAVIVGELVYNIMLLRRDHPPTDNRVLLMIGVERKPPRTDPSYNADDNNSSTQEDIKY